MLQFFCVKGYGIVYEELDVLTRLGMSRQEMKTKEIHFGNTDKVLRGIPNQAVKPYICRQVVKSRGRISALSSFAC